MNDELHDTAARLRRSVARLNRRLRYQGAGRLSPAQVSVLALLDKHESLTLGELAQLEQVRPPSVTPLVQSLEGEGLISCVKDEQDRRATRVRIEAAGRRELEADRESRNAYLVAHLAALSATEQHRARDLVAFLEGLVEGS
jgi:DNA-binding MarR family transcriptional regulator